MKSYSVPSQSSGDQALDLLQHLCANDLDVPVGHIVHTGMLNERGGYENDCSVVRLSKNRFQKTPVTNAKGVKEPVKRTDTIVLSPASSSCRPQTSRSTVGPG